MNFKRIAALSTLGALILSAGPAMAANQTGTVLVKWNTQTLSTLTLTTQASAASTHTNASGVIFWNGNGSTTSGCNGTIDTVNAGTESGTSVAGTVNFGNIQPDATDYTNCLETNAVNALVASNDTTGWTVGVQASSGAPATYDTAGGSLLCDYFNGTYANNLAYTASGRVAAVANTSATACAGAGVVVPTAANTTNIYSQGASASGTTGTNLGQDLELVLANNASSGPQSVTLTYTLVSL